MEESKNECPDEIRILVDRPRGKKNNNLLRVIRGRPVLVTNPETRKAESFIAKKIADKAVEAGWDIPMDEFVELDIEYDNLIDKIIVIVRRTHQKPGSSWGGRVDIQNMVDTVADALEEKRGHPGIIINDNRISEVRAVRKPLIAKVSHDSRNGPKKAGSKRPVKREGLPPDS